MAPLPISFGNIQIHTDPIVATHPETPDPCQEFFSSLHHNNQHPPPNVLVTFPTKDKLSWAMEKCPDSLEHLADALGISKKSLDGQVEFDSSIGPRRLVVPDVNWSDLPTTTLEVLETSEIPEAKRSVNSDTLYHPADTFGLENEDPNRPVCHENKTIERRNLSPPTKNWLDTSSNPTNTTHTNKHPISTAISITFLSVFIIFLITSLLYLLTKRHREKRKVAEAARANRAITPSEAEKWVKSQWADLDRKRLERRHSERIQKGQEGIELQNIGAQENGVIVKEPEEVYSYPRRTRTEPVEVFRGARSYWTADMVDEEEQAYRRAIGF